VGSITDQLIEILNLPNFPSPIMVMSSTVPGISLGIRAQLTRKADNLYDTCGRIFWKIYGPDVSLACGLKATEFVVYSQM
jgi:hypothetical protein